MSDCVWLQRQKDVAEEEEEEEESRLALKPALQRPSKSPKRSPRVSGKKPQDVRRRPSKMSPPRPPRVSRTTLSPERDQWRLQAEPAPAAPAAPARSPSAMEIRPGMSREEEDAAMEERALAAIEARLQRLAGEYDSHYKKKEGSPTKRGVTASTRRLREASPPRMMRTPEPEPEPEPEQALPREFDQYSDVPSTPPTDEEDGMGMDESAATVEAAAVALEMQVEEFHNGQSFQGSPEEMAPGSPVLLPSRTTVGQGSGDEGLSWLGRWGLVSIASQLVCS